jgi:C4-dicarboxylate-binding protein DctP
MNKMIFLKMLIGLALVLTSGLANATEYTFKIAHAVSPKTLTHKLCMDFKEIVETKTNGKVKVMVFPAGQVGGELEIVDKISKDVVQAGYLSIMSFSNMAPRLRFLTLPYLWPSWDSFNDYMISEEARKLYKDIESKNILFVAVSNIAEFGITTLKEINRIEDLKGLKIRTQESPIPLATFRALGASPMPLAFPELYQALKRGVFDGTSMSAQFILTSKFYEVCKYHLISQSFWLPCAFGVNKKYWEGLPDDLRKIMQTTLDELFSELIIAEKKGYVNNIKELQEKGMKIKVLSKTEALKHKDLTKQVRADFAKEYGLEDELKKLEAIYEPQWKKYDELVKWYFQ